MAASAMRSPTNSSAPPVRPGSRPCSATGSARSTSPAISWCSRLRRDRRISSGWRSTRRPCPTWSAPSAETIPYSSPSATPLWPRSSRKVSAARRSSAGCEPSLRHFDMPAEPEAHGREQFVAEGAVDAAAIAREQGGGENVRWNRFLHRRIDRPLALPAIGDLAREMLKRGIVREPDGAKIQQPGGNDRAPPPHFADIGAVY